MADVTLVFAASSRLPKEQFRRTTGPPLGALYLASTLRQNGYTVEVRDYQLNEYERPLEIDSFVHFATADSPVLGISCFSQMLPLALAAARRLRARRPEQAIILGGPGPSGAAAGIVRHFHEIDAVCCGEGEATVVELVQRLLDKQPLNDVAGIAWRNGDVCGVNPPRPRIADLDQLPLPAYDAIDLGRYDFAYVMTARGCPYHCAFCEVSSLWQHQTTWRGLDGVIDELRLLRERYGRQTILISDDTFVLRPKRVKEFCRRLVKEKLDLRWWCYGRVNHMDDELMAAMADAGCRLVFYGMESGSNSILRRIGKGFTVEAAESVVARSLEYFSVDVSFIWGYPFETLDDFVATLESIWRVLRMDPRIAVYLSLLSPLPLSPLQQEFASQLCFSDELVTYGEFAFEPARSLGGRLLDDELLAMIRQYPETFSAHYHYPTESLREKTELLRRFLGTFQQLVGRVSLSDAFRVKLEENPERVLNEDLASDELTDRLAVSWLSSVLRYRKTFGDRGALSLGSDVCRESGGRRSAR